MPPFLRRVAAVFQQRGLLGLAEVQRIDIRPNLVAPLRL